MIVQIASDGLLFPVDQSYLQDIKQYLVGNLIKISVRTKRPEAEELKHFYATSECKINGP